jgi:PhzF family phenazine biosynthesis protein
MAALLSLQRRHEPSPDPIYQEPRAAMTTTLPLYQVDAFTDRPFAGNPAAVCLLPAARDAAWMQHVAAEMNLSETAFLVPRTDGYDLRWFTPTVEVDLCGHATLASAHVLWETKQLSADQFARFHTRSGVLTCTQQAGRIEMDFPATPASECPPLPGLAEALGAPPRWLGKTRFDLLAEMDSEAVIRDLKPDFARIAALGGRGFIVTARATSPGLDFVSRFFAPAAGVNEDPVTGSAHCCLATYWAERLGKKELTGYQASARGGLVGVQVVGDRVRLRGQAVIVLRGELLA